MHNRIAHTRTLKDNAGLAWQQEEHPPSTSLAPPEYESPPMDQAQLNWLTNFIWNIADDVLRDIYVRGKYRDVILPMTVLRRLDAVLEPTKQAVLEMKAALDKEQIAHRRRAARRVRPGLLQHLALSPP